MSIGTAPLLRGAANQSSGVDNDVATATAAAVSNQTHLVLGVEAHYSAAVSGIRTVTVTYNSVSIVHRWDFSNGPFIYNYPVALKGAMGGAVTCALAASGTGGTSGYATIFTATD